MAVLIDHTPIVVLVLVILIGLAAAAFAGHVLRRFVGDGSLPASEGQEAYIVSAVLGLLALLMGFTLSLSLDRFEARRTLVLDEANAIGTAYLRTQLLSAPHRDRIGQLLANYLDNRIGFAEAEPDEQEQMLRRDDKLLTDLWAATAAAFDNIRTLDFSTAYLDSINAVIDLDTSRRTAREARVPAEVLGLLIVITLVSSGILGFVLVGPRRQVAATVLLMLLAMALVLILDIDRPSLGLVRESQKPLEDLRRSIASTPSATYNQWRGGH